LHGERTRDGSDTGIIFGRMLKRFEDRVVRPFADQERLTFTSQNERDRRKDEPDSNRPNAIDPRRMKVIFEP
jgi:hypothetical protein